MASVSHWVWGRETRYRVFLAARLGLLSLFPLTPLNETRSWGWGARKLVMIWACVFFPPLALGIPENSFRPNPNGLSSGSEQ